MKYIIEFISGCKGDLLNRFLNRAEDNIAEHYNNKTIELNQGGPNWLKAQNPAEQTLERIENNLKNNPYQFISGHYLMHLSSDNRYVDLLNKYEYKVIRVHADRKYWTTVRIESIFKNLEIPLEDDHQYPVKISNRLWFDKTSIDHYDPLENVNRLIKNNMFASRFGLYEQIHNDTKHRDIFLNYEDLYINFNLENEIFQGLDIEYWKHLVEKSWLKNETKVGNEIFNLNDLGYRQN